LGLPIHHRLQRLSVAGRAAYRWPVLFALAASRLIAGCTAPAGVSRDPRSYLNDASYRRAGLEASIVNAGNGYSRLRLDHYATGKVGDWERLPEWNPVTEPVAAAELSPAGDESPKALTGAASALMLLDADTSQDDSVLIALGRMAFARYPAQLAPYMSAALASRDAAARYGAWVDDARGVGGLVRARMADGSIALALTCSTCHAAKRSGEIEDGAPNAELDLGRAILDASAVGTNAADGIAAWGAGRLDVTTSDGTEPVRIPDLRPVRFLTHLHHDATLANHDRTALAIRIETLLITSHGQVVRPPRMIAWALAAYVASLAETLPPVRKAELVSARGARVFAHECESCHAPPGLTGPPVSLAEIGTDPALGLSPDRGTGMYRVPSLRGLGSRGPLLHDASLPSIAALLDAARMTSEFSARLHGTGAVPGHRYGLDLTDADRAALVAYLEAL
jgi:cytochrome c5